MATNARLTEILLGRLYRVRLVPGTHHGVPILDRGLQRSQAHVGAVRPEFSELIDDQPPCGSNLVSVAIRHCAPHKHTRTLVAS